MTDTSGSAPIIYDFDPRNLPPELLQAVGLVATAAALTESVLQDLIGGLLDLDNVQTLALTAQMSGNLKDFIARSLIELKAPTMAEVDKIDHLLDRVNKAMEKRNALLHNSFSRHPETGEVFSWRSVSRGSPQIKFAPVVTADLEADAVEIYEAGMALVSFMMSRGIEPSIRTELLRKPFDRSRAAREVRRNVGG